MLENRWSKLENDKTIEQIEHRLTTTELRFELRYEPYGSYQATDKRYTDFDLKTSPP